MYTGYYAQLKKYLADALENIKQEILDKKYLEE